MTGVRGRTWVGVGANHLRMPAELPYGDQRRIEIARALEHASKIDEATPRHIRG